MRYILGGLLGGLWATFILYGAPVDTSTAAGLAVVFVPAFLLGVVVAALWPRRQ